MRHRRLALFAALVVVAFLGAAVPVGATPVTQWVRPVAGRVVRPFDPPKSRFGAGHLGVDLAAPPGAKVVAAGPGVVAFAGSVAGALHVVIAHAGNLRTSYSFLATVAVRRGDTVARGDRLGTTGGKGQGHDGSVVHFALRSGDTYVDPMQLFAPVDLTSVVHLAPTSIPPRPASGSSERRGIVAGLAHSVGAVVRVTGRFAGAALADGRDALAAAGRGVQRVTASAFPLQAAALRGATKWWAQRGHCDAHAPQADGTGGSDHRVMIVAGIDSSITAGGPSSHLPAQKLGYDPTEISYFSYAHDGGDYTPAQTEQSLHTSALRLGVQLRALERRDPGREVDLIAHSQGGVVVQDFLANVYRADDPAYPPLGTVVTLATPFWGDAIATGVAEVRGTLLGLGGLNAADWADRQAGRPLPESESPAVRQLAATSEFMNRMRHSELPAMVQLTAIGGAQDVIVPATSATRPGAKSTMVFPHTINAHSGIVTDPSALQDTRAAIEDKPLPCRSLVSMVTGEVAATAISTGERLAGEIGALAADTAGGA